MWQYELQYSGSQVNRSHLFESIQENYLLQLKLHVLNHNSVLYNGICLQLAKCHHCCLSKLQYLYSSIVYKSNWGKMKGCYTWVQILAAVTSKFSYFHEIKECITASNFTRLGKSLDQWLNFYQFRKRYTYPMLVVVFITLLKVFFNLAS